MEEFDALEATFLNSSQVSYLSWQVNLFLV